DAAGHRVEARVLRLEVDDEHSGLRAVHVEGGLAVARIHPYHGRAAGPPRVETQGEPAAADREGLEGLETELGGVARPDLVPLGLDRVGSARRAHSQTRLARRPRTLPGRT